MNAEPRLDVLPPPPEKPQVETPQITVSDEDAEQILSELGLTSLQPSVDATKKKEVVGVDIRRALRLGIFVEENAVRLDNAKVLIADQVLMLHLQRLNAKADEMKTVDELKEIAYPIGYIAAQLKKTSKKTIVLQAGTGGPGRPAPPSWAPGEKVLPNPPTNPAA